MLVFLYGIKVYYDKKIYNLELLHKILTYDKFALDPLHIRKNYFCFI